MLCLFDVKDKEPKVRKDGKELLPLASTDEVLLPIEELDKYREDTDHLRASIHNQREAQEAKIKKQLAQLELEIQDIKKLTVT